MESLLVVVLVIALLVAVAMCVFAWRVLRRDRERSEVRIARLRAMASSADSGPEPDIVFEPDYEPEIVHQQTVQHPGVGLFAASAPAPAGPRWGTFVLVVLVCMSIGAGAVYGLYGSSTTFPTFAWPTLSASTPAASPLELLSLTHRRDPGGDFIVTGLVQNPVNGRTTSGLVAVVYLFDAEGEYFASGKAAIDIPALAAGDQSPFMIRLPNITKVSRYRLGFRMNDGGVFAHVDRRGEPLVGTTAAVVEESR